MTDVVTQHYPLNEFNKVLFKSIGKIKIRQGEKTELIVSADERFINNLIVSVENETLEIKSKKEFLTLTDFNITQRNIQMQLSIRELSAFDLAGAARVDFDTLTADDFHIILGGAGDIYLPQLKADELKAELKGAGKLTVLGEVNAQTVQVFGAANYDARGLKCQSTEVELSGAGTAVVCADEILDATITGVGSVKYIGNPMIRKKITGLGSFSRLK